MTATISETLAMDMDELDLHVEDIATVPEAFRPLYAEQDGKYRLKVKGVDEFTSAKAALENARKTERAIRNEVQKWRELGRSPDEVAEMVRKMEEIASKGDPQAAIKRREEQFAKEREELQKQIEAALAAERKAVISTQLTAALTKAGVTDEGLELLPDRLMGRIRYEIQDGERVTQILSEDGVTPVGSFDDLVREASAKYPSLFRGDGKTGGGMRPNNGAGGPGAKKRSEMSEREKAAYVEQYGLDRYKALPL